MKPFFSILTTAYNVEEYIMDAVGSVAVQTENDYELIIVDDCSEIEVKKAINNNCPQSAWKIISSKLQIYRLKENHCYGYALNYAFSKAKGKYAVILDGDDILFPHALASMYACIKENPGHALYYSKYACLHSFSLEQGEPFSMTKCKDKLISVKVVPLPKTYTYLDLFIQRTEVGSRGVDKDLRGVQVSHLKVVDMEAYKKTEGVSKHLRRGVDVDLILRMEEVGSLHFCNECLYIYRRRDGSISRNAHYDRTIDPKEVNYDIINMAKKRRGIE